MREMNLPKRYGYASYAFTDPDQEVTYLLRPEDLANAPADQMDFSIAKLAKPGYNFQASLKKLMWNSVFETDPNSKIPFGRGIIRSVPESEKPSKSVDDRKRKGKSTRRD